MPATKLTPDLLAAPSNLSPAGKKAHAAFLAFLKKSKHTNTGGCETFYSPKDWAERGEEYGKESVLVIVHDGGDVAPVCNLDYECYDLNNEMVEAMSAAGFFVEGCTSWYSAVYPI
jgi:hypothetical protein